MHISTLVLNNIRSYVNQSITFDSGINVLYGNIGSGKSTLLQAIEVALFGFKKGDGNYILRKGEAEGSIQVTFQDDSQSITIARYFKRTKQGITQSKGTIQINSSPVEEFSTQEQNMFIFNYFQFPLSFINKDKTLMYRFTYYTPQEQLKEILTIQSDKRLDILRKVFNIDNYKQLQHVYSISSKQLSKELLIHQTKYNELPQSLEEDISHHQKQIESYKVSIEHLEKKEIELSQKLKKIHSNKQKLEEKRATIKEQVRTSKKLQEERDTVDKKVEEYTKQIHTLKHQLSHHTKQCSRKKELLLQKLEQLEKINENKESIENKYRQLQTSEHNIALIEKQIAEFNFITSLESQLHSIHHTIVKYKCRAQDIIVAQKKEEKLIKRKEKLSTELDNLKLGQENISKQLIELKTQYTSFKEQMSQVLNISSQQNLSEQDRTQTNNYCPLCHQPIDTSHIIHLQEKLQTLEDNYSQSILHKEKERVESSIEQSQKKLEGIVEELKQFEKDQYELESINKTISQYEEEYKKIQLDVNTRKEQIKSNSSNDTNNATQINSTQKLNKLNEKLHTLQTQKKQLETTISQIEKSRQNIELLEKEKKELEISIQAIEKEVYKLNTQIQTLTEKLQDCDKRVKEIGSKIETLNSSIIMNQKIDDIIEKQESIEQKLLIRQNAIIKEKSEYETSIKYIISQLKELETLVEKKQLLNTTIQQVKEQKDFLSQEMSEMCKVIEETLFIELLSDVSQALRTYFIQLIEEQDIDVYLRDDFSLIIEQNGYEVDVEQLSGGEKSALALSYRLALKEVIERHFKHTTILDFIILDEPTDGFSQTQVQKFASILQHGNFKQAFLVSHDQSLSTAGEYVFVVEKEHHTSSIELKE
ncbi:MAG: AAA family ATPase [Candidatus Nanoarchaeia archaeon]